jgi:dipeptidyl aminopeptidase/acylaminoacyl peptidase
VTLTSPCAVRDRRAFIEHLGDAGARRHITSIRAMTTCPLPLRRTVCSINILAVAALLPVHATHAQAARGAAPGAASLAIDKTTIPSFRQWLGLRTVGAPAIAPDGASVAYTVTGADWENNRFDSEIWIARPGVEPFQLTFTEKESSTVPHWSPDGQRIGFLADRGEGRQIYLIRAAGGEARRLTSVKDGVTDFEWSPDGSRIAFTATAPDTAMVARRKTYGDYTDENVDFRLARLWVVATDIGRAMNAGAPAPCVNTDSARRGADTTARTCLATPTARLLPSGGARNVGSFAWSPDGSRLAFSHTPSPLLSAGELADIAVVDVASGTVRSVVSGPGADTGAVWSPDGAQLLFSTAAGDTAASFYRNSRLAVVSAAGGAVRVLTASFDENPGSAVWLPGGIRFLAAQGTRQQLMALDPATGVTRVLLKSPDVIRATSFSKDGATVAFVAEDALTLPEVYRTTLGSASKAAPPARLTSMTTQLAGWTLGTREVVTWASRDGARIEGVLFKPRDYDASRRYPLLVVIHGGPTGVSRPVLTGSYVYPVEQFLAKGAVVLMPNYRGSAGYGEKFRALNVRNLGVGDAWDVLSGVDSLIARGIADSTRMGSMGWSQGGYISAFLTTTSQRFKAISVGAGISDWMTYYVSTDIHPFTRQYLQATPWDDPAIYAKTSPITYIKQARTPTLIQHGELDRRVPIANAYELYQGLQDVGVPTRLVVYKGFGHGITKPKEQLAATWHNWQWFAKYLWGEDVTMPADGDVGMSR